MHKYKTMLWAIFGILLFLFILYLLFVPLDIVINVGKNQYFVRIWGLAKVALEGHETEFIRIKLNTLFTRFYFYPLRKKKKEQKKKIEKKARKRNNIQSNLKYGLQVIKSFKVKKLLLDIDTGDCIENAKLYPAFAFLNHHVGTFQVNFEGRVNMVLHLQNRPINIIKSFINI
ncbi:hypothetical protein [uncultured Eudoraea sp.]|uniref:hypothetical protein n=1 Tax=uncultured Eudoraea sp. TaxID=1035614 RepID=UPI002615134B|nr:hypothetical protein [uncultured Eudoraea sp.]